ncbi:class I SAM-dependent DNA methyltransferase [Marinibacterium profundimaris]|uniref:Methyltransferase n=1 Tax=Marinibacterium profundimaris TaxID=1679460 RepID=A0A225NIL5_9RHOB|nr:class I SAM-dependent methyltransferase [Marinibacterium profundimaris]OWU73656.1 methyltransferase [Marinibacterium profundimaris]
MTSKDTGLEAAYSLQTPDDNRDLYARWAEDYDNSFAAAEAYALPQATARAYADAGGAGPVLDVGAGTGLCGVALAQAGIAPVDGVDISPEMLEVARGKGCYRDLLEADLYVGVGVADGTYPGVVSSGTFTHGHVGPEVLEELLRLAAPGAVFALAINGAHFEAHGFDAALTALGDRISGLSLPEVRIYGDGATGEHKDDMAKIAVFRKV